MKIIPFEILTLEGDGHHIILEVEILDKPFKMVLDTGASKTVLDRETLSQSGIQDEHLINTNILSSGLGTNQMKSFMFDLPTLKIGKWQCKNLQVAVLDLSSINYAYSQMNFSPVVGVLGGDILLNYGAVINYKKRSLTLNDRDIKTKKLLKIQ